MGSKGGQEVTNKKPKSVKPRDYREWDKYEYLFVFRFLICICFIFVF